MKVGIIGATGMIGHHVARAVADSDDELYIIHRASSDLTRIADLSFQSREGDLNDKESLSRSVEDLDYVLNCGAYYPTVPRPLKEEMTTATRQMDNFIEACQKQQIKKMLYLGGAIAIPKVKAGMADENGTYNTEPANRAPYVQVKWQMDKMAREAGKSGVPIVVGIPSMTFGEYDYGPTTGRLIVEVANGTLPAYVRGDRNIVYAGDAGRGLFLACQKGTPGERYLITGENITMDSLIEIIVKKSGINKKMKTLPLPLAKTISKIQEAKYRLLGGEPPLLSSTAIAVMSAGQFLDGSKAANDLGYKPSHSTEQMVEKALDWFKQVKYVV